jgi:hypothetical protein
VAAIDSGQVFALGATGILNALDLRTGSLMWTRNILKDNNASEPVWGVAISPLIHGGRVIVSAGGTPARALVAYDRATGSSATVESARNFANKLWNAARYTLGRLEALADAPERGASLADTWIRARAAQTMVEVRRQITELAVHLDERDGRIHAGIDGAEPGPVGLLQRHREARSLAHVGDGRNSERQVACIDRALKPKFESLDRRFRASSVREQATRQNERARRRRLLPFRPRRIHRYRRLAAEERRAQRHHRCG